MVKLFNLTHVLLESAVPDEQSFEPAQFLLCLRLFSHAAPDFIHENIGANPANGGMSRHQLRQYLVARSAFLDHLLDAAQLPFDTSKAMQYLCLLCHIPWWV